MSLAWVITVSLGGGAVASVMAILRGLTAFKEDVADRERAILSDLSRRERAWKEEVDWWTKREERMGRRIVGGGRRLEIPVLKNPPPPPPTRGAMHVVPLPSVELAAKVAAPAKAEPEPCPHLFTVPVTDALGVRLAGICLACDAQVTNEEWVRVGW